MELVGRGFVILFNVALVPLLESIKLPLILIETWTSSFCLKNAEQNCVQSDSCAQEAEVVADFSELCLHSSEHGVRIKGQRCLQSALIPVPFSLSSPPQESGNVHGISVTSVAILPCPSVSFAPTPSARITRREPWCRRRWTAASAAPHTTPNLLWHPSTGARSSANWKHRTLWKRQRSEFG